ncbi:MAG: FKBP-type peptidyl-prolyl cis-trans isomerase [Paludibacter sp.]|jgi:FKBP-type peptidyl-prolyl cis-trans isomerase FklB|nr:FKBP-type peptidyl-prolyl cis-trans isomerase [Bacteroidales bacterium]
MEKISYALGVSLGNNLKNSGFSQIDTQRLTDGIRHAIKGEPLDMSLNEAQKIVNEYLQQLQKQTFENNIREGKEFLTNNAKRPGVKTTASGLQYEILTRGKGAIPKASDTVKVHYHGTLISGKVFDSSVQRGEPATFGVTQVIQGWVEALQLMPAGSKWKLYIPSELAYGERGAGQLIGPHTCLIFEVELLDIL